MITSIMTSKGMVAVNSEDLPSGGAVYNNILYLTVTYLQKHVPLASVDSGSAVSVYP